MDRPPVYISGGFYAAYKNIIRRELGEEFELIDPEFKGTEPELSLPAYYVSWDLEGINRSRVVIAVQTDYPYVYGMAAEVGWAARHGVPVIYVCLTKRVDCFLAALSRAIFTDLAAACQFIKERYRPVPKITDGDAVSTGVDFVTFPDGRKPSPVTASHESRHIVPA